MANIIIIAVLAAWAAVLLPPLLRSRTENRPGSSVHDFRRQLSTLQRTVPTKSMSSMRSMARPLAQAPTQRTAAARPARGDHDDTYTSPLQRRSEVDASRGARRPARPVSRREMLRRRRTNVLFILAGSTVLTMFLAATTKSSAMVYAFAFSFVSLCGYCYKLAQLRQYEQDSAYTDQRWFNAA